MVILRTDTVLRTNSVIETDITIDTPLTILGNLAWWVRADQGITVATGVSQWNDLSGNNINFAQSTGASQPTFTSNAVNGQPAVTFDGSNDFIYNSAFSRSVPGTQPFYWWLICKQITWTNQEYIINDTGATIYSQVSTPNVRQYNGLGSTPLTAFTLNTYRRVEAQFSNSTADYIKIGSTNGTGVNSGNSAQQTSNIVLGCAFTSGNPGSPVGYCNVEIAEAFCFFGIPTTQQRNDLDTYCTNRYGSGLV